MAGRLDYRAAFRGQKISGGHPPESSLQSECFGSRIGSCIGGIRGGSRISCRTSRRVFVGQEFVHGIFVPVSSMLVILICICVTIIWLRIGQIYNSVDGVKKIGDDCFVGSAGSNSFVACACNWLGLWLIVGGWCSWLVGGLWMSLSNGRVRFCIFKEIVQFFA